MRHTLSRRDFLAASASASLTIPLLAQEAKKTSANEKINLGFIGVGTMGRGHLGGFLGMKDVQVVAVCDVVAERRDDAQKRVNDHYAKDKKGAANVCANYVDFRELLAHKDLDAVVIGTPDHWHAITSILAARGKKDVYCEKPLTQNIAEGRRIVQEVAKAKIIFQTGSQQRSEFNNHFRTAVEHVRNGRLGKIKRVNIGVGNPSRACDLPTQDVPKGTDWDLWVGPAPFRGYHEILCPKGIHKHFPAWREYREFAGGGVADMGAHHFDIAQWALNMDESGPVEIIPPEKDQRGLKLIYANGTEMVHGGNVDCEFIGEKGTIRVWRSKIESDPAELLKAPITEKEWHCNPASNHKRNWIECIRSRQQPICVAETGHRSATVCHLTNIGYQLRKKLKWDPVKEQFDDADANKLVSREARDAWKKI